MTCFTPLTAYQNTDKTKDQKLVFNSNRKHPTNQTIAERYANPKNPTLEESGYKRLSIPCGKCTACRLDYSMKWAGRLIAEATLYGDQNCFVTLTYSPEHLPEHKHLVKADAQKFLKRLRTHHSGAFPVEGEESPNGRHPIRFYMAGEYGDDHGRPHYHAALLNWKPDDLEEYKTNKHGDKLYKSKTLDKIWGLGFVIVGDLTAESASYVSRYITKKIGGVQALDHYAEIDPNTGELLTRPREFATMSLKPGIGMPFLRKYPTDALHGQLILKKKNKILKIGIPQYIEKKLALIYPEQMATFKEKKQKTLERKMRDNPEEFTPERMAVKAKLFDMKTKMVHKRDPEV
jgi:hypothetical protein